MAHLKVSTVESSRVYSSSTDSLRVDSIASEGPAL